MTGSVYLAAPHPVRELTWVLAQLRLRDASPAELVAARAPGLDLRRVRSATTTLARVGVVLRDEEQGVSRHRRSMSLLRGVRTVHVSLSSGLNTARIEVFDLHLRLLAGESRAVCGAEGLAAAVRGQLALTRAAIDRCPNALAVHVRVPASTPTDGDPDRLGVFAQRVARGTGLFTAVTRSDVASPTSVSAELVAALVHHGVRYTYVRPAAPTPPVSSPRRFDLWDQPQRSRSSVRSWAVGG